MNKKRLVIAASLTMTVALIFTSATVGYLTSTKTAVNRIAVASMIPDIHENSSSTPSSVNSVPEGNPGVFPKEVRVQNTNITNAVDAYVRVQLVPTLRDERGNLGGNFKMETPANHEFNGKNYSQSVAFVPFGEPKNLQILLVFDKDWNNSRNQNGYWQYRAADNCFYYSDILPPDKDGKTKTNPLLKEVRFFGTESAKWQSSFHLDVLTDSIQADGKIGGSPAKYAAEEAWPVKIDSNRKLAPVA
jgi:hypothetical protein